MKSLEQRLQIGLAITLICLMTLFWVFGNTALREMTESWIASRLEHDAEGLLSAMVIQDDGVKVRWRRINQIYSQPLSGHYYVIKFNDGEIIRSRSLWDQTLDIADLPTGHKTQQIIKGPSEQEVLLLVLGYQKQGRQFTLAIAEDMTPVYAERDTFLRWFAVLAVAGLLTLLSIQSLVIRFTLKKLNNVRSEIQQLEQGKQGSLSEDVPTEVLPLVQEFNHLLRLLSRRLERSRNGLGNLAHALKGPLNLLVQHFDAPESEANRKQAAKQTLRIKQLMDRELKRARLAGKELSSQRFNPSEELPDLIAVLQQIYRDKSIDITYQVDSDLASFGDREDMLELLGNLLDNACKWASQKVICQVQDGQEIVIRVEDDGAGLADGQIDEITQRGSRLDESIAGHGLGLAITGDIVKLYGGRLFFQRSQSMGGLCVEVGLPNSSDIPINS